MRDLGVQKNAYYMSFSLLLLLSPNKQLDMIHKTNIWGLLTGGKEDADQPEILGPKKWHGGEFPGLFSVSYIPTANKASSLEMPTGETNEQNAQLKPTLSMWGVKKGIA